MSRQHAVPLLLSAEGVHPLTPLSLGGGQDQVSEAELQDLIHRFPQLLPISEIDSIFAGAVPICRELATRAGPIDNLLLTAAGLPVLVECKLWRNPQARREVVGQILDYAKELARWTASDLQREASRSLKRSGNVLVEALVDAGYTVDEIAFNDALSANLKRGRFLLLIVGDGIQESVESIAEYLQQNVGLHFTFGLVELPIYLMPDGKRLVSPRIVARTAVINRSVIAVPEGYKIDEPSSDEEMPAEDMDPASRIPFWRDFVSGLRLDDPEQIRPKATRQGYVTMAMPVPGGTAWLVSYRSELSWEVGVYMSFSKESLGARVNERLLEDRAEILAELAGTASAEPDKSGRQLFQDSMRTGPWTVPSERERALEWLRMRTNDFVNVLRPQIKRIVQELGEGT